MSTLATRLSENSAAWELPYRGRSAWRVSSSPSPPSSRFSLWPICSTLERASPDRAPAKCLKRPIFYTICLLSSSLTIHLAGKLLERGWRAAFLALWLLTLILGALFLYGTALEWHRLIYEHGLTISTNLFGTTYYSLVGLHAFHVTAGLILLTVVLLFGLAGRVGPDQSSRVDVLSLYWHFVDAVWVVVFTVVYVLGR